MSKLESPSDLEPAFATSRAARWFSRGHRAESTSNGKLRALCLEFVEFVDRLLRPWRGIVRRSRTLCRGENEITDSKGYRRYGSDLLRDRAAFSAFDFLLWVDGIPNGIIRNGYEEDS